MPRHDVKHLEEQRRTLIRSTGLILLIFAIGVIGYAWIGGDQYSLVDAIYMTIITLTTVGYGEIINPRATPPAGCSRSSCCSSAWVSSSTSSRT
jgi:hypothetical protein